MHALMSVFKGLNINSNIIDKRTSFSLHKSTDSWYLESLAGQLVVNLIYVSYFLLHA